MEILTQEFLKFYNEKKNGNKVEIPALSFQYKDFAAWQNFQQQNTELKEEAHRFWAEKLINIVPLLLPVHIHGNKEDRTGAGYRSQISLEIKEKLNRLGKENNNTLFMMMFSIYLMLLSRLSNQEDVICSIISAGREHFALHNIVGMFLNSILFRTNVVSTEKFSDYLARINREVLETFKYQDYPIELVFKELKIKYPDVPTSFNFLNIQEQTLSLDIESAKIGKNGTIQDVKFDIELYITEYKNGISLDWRFRKSLFDFASIEYIVGEYHKLIDFFVSDVHHGLQDYKNLMRKNKRVIKRTN